MIVRILSQQIPVFWNAIKVAATEADEVESKHLQSYLNELLHALLSDKAQCFVALDEGRVLVGLLITRVQVDKITAEKYLLLQAAYIWQKQEMSEWTAMYNAFKTFAEKEQCKYIAYSSKNPKMWGRSEALGFKEKTRTFTLSL
uniref:N-acetyltransferase domain-containing protein n=1 Tax=viral metagenome TaxID=1070528 RepID=A0A6M3JCZ0_9ZZZZ